MGALEAGWILTVVALGTLVAVGLVQVRRVDAVIRRLDRRPDGGERTGGGDGTPRARRPGGGPGEDGAPR